MKHFQTVLITEGSNNYSGNVVVDDPRLKKYYDEANEKYQAFIDEINHAPGVFLSIEIDDSGRAVFRVENARNDLMKRLKTAGLY